MIHFATDFSKASSPMSIEWRWTGFTPARLLHEEDMRHMLRYLAAVPRQGIRYVRIHYLLELVSAKNLGTEHPVYDWSELERALDPLVENGFRLFFELMGNPSGFFDDYKDRRQAEAWKRLVRDLVLHFTQRYGKEVIESWTFETWNEPDCGWWKQDVDAFLIYYDACSEGLREANPKLLFGGPGTARTLSEPILRLLGHADKGINFFTGQQDVRLDFISVHEKGAWGNPADVPTHPERMIARTRQLREHLRKNHPKLLDKPIMNNECDPQVGWRDPHTWRGSPYFPAILTKALCLHYAELIDEDDAPFTILGNDHGFIGGWPQRTLLARHAQTGWETRRFEFIKKSGLNLKTGLSLLGKERFPLTVEGTPHAFGLATGLGLEGYALLVCHVDNRPRMSAPAEATFDLRGLAPGTYTRVHFRIDEDHGNPFALFEQQFGGDPVFTEPLPSKELLEQMRACAELTTDGRPEPLEVPSDGHLRIRLPLPMPGVCFLLLLRKEAFAAPAKVENLRAEPYHGYTADAPVLLTWKPLESRSIQRYEVEYRDTTNGPWLPVQTPPSPDGTAVHTTPERNLKRAYRVRAVDFWGRCGPWSS
jgi:L-iduronidase